MIARARQLLAPPAEVNLQLQKDVLVASGTAPIDWIDTSLRIAPVIPGVTRLDASSLIASSVDALARSIEAAIPMAIKGSTEFTLGGEQIVRAQLARLTSLDALGRVAKRQFTVELVGEADADGPGIEPPAQRASRGPRPLHAQAQSLDHVTFTAIGVGSREGQIRRPAKRRSREIVASLSASPPPTDDNLAKNASQQDLHARRLWRWQDQPGVALREQHLLRYLSHDGRREDRQEEGGTRLGRDDAHALGHLRAGRTPDRP